MNRVDWKNKELLEKTVNQSITQSEVLVKLGVLKSSGNFQTLLKYVKFHGLDISHFVGNKVAYQKLKKSKDDKTLSNLFFNMNKQNFESLCQYYKIDLQPYKRNFKISGIDLLKLQKLLLEKSLKELELVFNAAGNAIKKHAIKNNLFLPTSIHKSYWLKVNNNTFHKITFDDLILENGQYKLNPNFNISSIVAK